ncbi:DUF4062 domain-containing protein [Prosthecobacter sp.]|uniref:DUF4062 domain-containing protein n=1 Tax=Prosthecobacter sp. TaxID=1965333 RepID=UPI003784D257
MKSEPTSIVRKYQVFISSTFKDLPERRRQVLDAVLDCEHIPVALERFSSHAEPVPNVIKRAIEQCQIYVVIVGYRYGSTLDVTGADGGMVKKSFTQMEYEHAVQSGLKILTFVVNDDDVRSLRAELYKSKDPDDVAEIRNEEAFQAFRAVVKNPDKHFACVFRHAEPEFKAEVIKSLFAVVKAPELRGWVREPENDSQRDAFTSISRNRYIVDIVGALSALDTLDSRVIKHPEEKSALARCFSDFYLQAINEKHLSLFFESGSTLIYVADQLGRGLTEARALDKNGNPHVQVSTNNVLAYLILWLKHLIPCTPFPWGTPEETYGAALGPLAINVAMDRSPLFPPGKLRKRELAEIRKLSDAAKKVHRPGNKTLLLAAASGLQLSSKIKVKDGLDKPDGILECRGPHVGSYKNKLFKRFMYETKHPLMIFITADKIDSEIDLEKCHFVMDDKEQWEQFINDHPLAFCVGCQRKELGHWTDIFKKLKFECLCENDGSEATAFIARNQKFQELFDKPNEIE